MSEFIIGTLRAVEPYLLAFTAICLVLVAVRVGWRAEVPADPFSHPFGEMPGFTAEQLRMIASKPHGVASQNRAESWNFGQGVRMKHFPIPPATPPGQWDTGSNGVEVTPTNLDHDVAARLDPREVFAASWRRPRG